MCQLQKLYEKNDFKEAKLLQVFIIIKKAFLGKKDFTDIILPYDKQGFTLTKDTLTLTILRSYQYYIHITHSQSM